MHGYFGVHPPIGFASGCAVPVSSTQEPSDGDILEYLGKKISYDHIRPCNCKIHRDDDPRQLRY